MNTSTLAASDTGEVLATCITATLSCGATLTGRLEYFRSSKTLVLFDEDGIAPVLLSVPAADAPVEHEALEPQEVLLRNWTEMRGAAEALAQLGLVELTGQEVCVGMFRLHGLVVRIL